jgi:hypothetical protein
MVPLTVILIGMMSFLNLVFGAITQAHAQAKGFESLQRLVLPHEEIPIYLPMSFEPYETWSLFLICNPSWLDKTNAKQLEELFAQYQLFGRSIGNRHLAVWFAPALDKEAQGAWTVDVDRNIDFCDKYHLLPSESPHIITTTKNPNLGLEEGDLWKLSLADQTDANIRTLLTKLADQVLVQGLDQEALGSEQWWRSWHSVLERAIRGLAEIATNITVTIKTDKFSLEVRYDKPQPQ